MDNYTEPMSRPSNACRREMSSKRHMCYKMHKFTAFAKITHTQSASMLVSGRLVLQELTAVQAVLLLICNIMYDVI